MNDGVDWPKTKETDQEREKYERVQKRRGNEDKKTQRRRSRDTETVTDIGIQTKTATGRVENERTDAAKENGCSRIIILVIRCVARVALNGFACHDEYTGLASHLIVRHTL